jgi:hypothetical protein
MLKKARLLTRPTPARQDAPFRRQGRSERRGEEVRPALRVTVRPCNESWRTDKPLQYFEYPRCPLNIEPLSDARTPLADFFSILLVLGFRMMGLILTGHDRRNIPYQATVEMSFPEPNGRDPADPCSQSCTSCVEFLALVSQRTRGRASCPAA